MSAEFIEIKCPGCGATVPMNATNCEFCDKPVLIRTFNSVAGMSLPEVTKYANSYKRELVDKPDNKELNQSLAMCYLKLKQYKPALSYFQKAMEDNFDDVQNYFYAAVCLLEGKKAFLASRPIIDQIETYLNDAISIEPMGIHYYFWAYIKYDYYFRKKFRTSPDYRECLQMAVNTGLSRYDAAQLFEILNVPRPEGF